MILVPFIYVTVSLVTIIYFSINLYKNCFLGQSESNIARQRSSFMFQNVPTIETSCIPFTPCFNNYYPVVPDLSAYLDNQILKIDGSVPLYKDGKRYSNKLPTIPEVSLILLFKKYNKPIKQLILRNNSMLEFPKIILKLPDLEVFKFEDNCINEITPEEFFILSQATVLSLRNNKLMSFKEFKRSEKLVELDLSQNNFTSLPDFNVFPNLKRLFLRDLKLSKLPGISQNLFLEQLEITGCSGLVFRGSDFKALKGLKYLTIKDTNNFFSLSGLSFLENLEELDLSFNPELTHGNMAKNDFSFLSKIKKLNIGSTGIRYLPFLNQIKEIVELDISYLNLGNDSPTFCSTACSTLEKLNLEGTQLKNLDILKNLNQLKYLNVSGCNIFVDSLYNYNNHSNLTHLSACCLGLRTIPSISKCLSLKSLVLASNSITEVKEEDLIANTNLEELDLSMNLFVSIPKLDFIKNLKHLKLGGNRFDNFNDVSINKGLLSLSFDCCSLRSIPDFILDLPLLEKCDLSSNYIKNDDIKKISNLEKLKHLDLSNNSLTVIPIEIKRLKNLVTLDLTGNCLDESGSDNYLGLNELKEWFGERLIYKDSTIIRESNINEENRQFSINFSEIICYSHHIPEVTTFDNLDVAELLIKQIKENYKSFCERNPDKNGEGETMSAFSTLIEDSLDPLLKKYFKRADEEVKNNVNSKNLFSPSSSILYRYLCFIIRAIALNLDSFEFSAFEILESISKIEQNSYELLSYFIEVYMAFKKRYSNGGDSLSEALKKLISLKKEQLFDKCVETLVKTNPCEVSHYLKIRMSNELGFEVYNLVKPSIMDNIKRYYKAVLNLFQDRFTPDYIINCVFDECNNSNEFYNLFISYFNNKARVSGLHFGDPQKLCKKLIRWVLLDLKIIKDHSSSKQA